MNNDSFDLVFIVQVVLTKRLAGINCYLIVFIWFRPCLQVEIFDRNSRFHLTAALHLVPPSELIRCHVVTNIELFSAESALQIDGRRV